MPAPGGGGCFKLFWGMWKSGGSAGGGRPRVPPEGGPRGRGRAATQRAALGGREAPAKRGARGPQAPPAAPTGARTGGTDRRALAHAPGTPGAGAGAGGGGGAPRPPTPSPPPAPDARTRAVRRGLARGEGGCRPGAPDGAASEGRRREAKQAGGPTRRPKAVHAAGGRPLPPGRRPVNVWRPTSGARNHRRAQRGPRGPPSRTERPDVGGVLKSAKVPLSLHTFP